jgi:hypothetical protein
MYGGLWSFMRRSPGPLPLNPVLIWVRSLIFADGSVTVLPLGADFSANPAQ